MRFTNVPPSAAWRHCDGRDGFEVVFLRWGPEGLQLQGHTAAVEDGEMWAVQYAIVVDAGWRTQHAHVLGWSAAGQREVALATDGAGSWLVDGAPAPQLDGCLDIDLESSSFTNALPVHRLGLEIG